MHYEMKKRDKWNCSTNSAAGQRCIGDRLDQPLLITNPSQQVFGIKETKIQAPLLVPLLVGRPGQRLAPLRSVVHLCLVLLMFPCVFAGNIGARSVTCNLSRVYAYTSVVLGTGVQIITFVCYRQLTIIYLSGSRGFPLDTVREPLHTPTEEEGEKQVYKQPELLPLGSSSDAQ